MILDVSNFDYPTFDAACLKANGVEGVIIGCQRENLARKMAAQCRDVGLRIVGTYAFLYFGMDTKGQTITAMKVAADYKAPYVCLDVEAHPPNEAVGMTPNQRIRELSECIAIVEGSSNNLTPVIYTYQPYWRSEMANTTVFSEYRLWHAHYLDYKATPFRVETVDYGGWTKLWAHQWTSTYDICGRKRDANHLYEEDDMTPEQEAKLDAVYAALTGGVPGVIEAWNQQGNSVLVAYNDLVFPALGRVDDHIANHSSGVGLVPDHSHEPGKVKRP